MPAARCRPAGQAQNLITYFAEGDSAGRVKAEKVAADVKAAADKAAAAYAAVVKATADKAAADKAAADKAAADKVAADQAAADQAAAVYKTATDVAAAAYRAAQEKAGAALAAARAAVNPGGSNLMGQGTGMTGSPINRLPPPGMGPGGSPPMVSSGGGGVSKPPDKAAADKAYAAAQAEEQAAKLAVDKAAAAYAAVVKATADKVAADKVAADKAAADKVAAVKAAADKAAADKAATETAVITAAKYMNRFSFINPSLNRCNALMKKLTSTPVPPSYFVGVRALRFNDILTTEYEASIKTSGGPSHYGRLTKPIPDEYYAYLKFLYDTIGGMASECRVAAAYKAEGEKLVIEILPGLKDGKFNAPNYTQADNKARTDALALQLTEFVSSTLALVKEMENVMKVSLFQEKMGPTVIKQFLEIR